MLDIRGACLLPIMLIFSVKKEIFPQPNLTLINPQKKRKVVMERFSLWWEAIISRWTIIFRWWIVGIERKKKRQLLMTWKWMTTNTIKSTTEVVMTVLLQAMTQRIKGWERKIKRTCFKTSWSTLTNKRIGSGRFSKRHLRLRSSRSCWAKEQTKETTISFWKTMMLTCSRMRSQITQQKGPNRNSHPLHRKLVIWLRWSRSLQNFKNRYNTPSISLFLSNSLVREN